MRSAEIKCLLLGPLLIVLTLNIQEVRFILQMINVKDTLHRRGLVFSVRRY